MIVTYQDFHSCFNVLNRVVDARGRLRVHDESVIGALL